MVNWQLSLSNASLSDAVPQWFARMPLLLQVPLSLGVLLLALPLTLATYFCASALWRAFSVRVLRNDGYDHIPRATHTSTRWWPWVGDLPAIRKAPPSEMHIQWSRELDSDVFLYRGMFYVPRIIMADAKALNHILGQQNSYDYPKPEGARNFLDNLLGNGLLVAEGDVHKRQRKIIQPAFNVSAMRDLTPLFFRHANAFVEKMASIVDETKGPAETAFLEGQTDESAKESRAKQPVLDISHYFGRVTLDIIGDAGFGHKFNAVKQRMDEQPDSIVESFRQLMKLAVNISVSDLIILGVSRIQGFAWVNRLPTKRKRVIRASRNVLDRTGQKIIEAKRAEIKAELRQNADDSKEFFDEKAKSKDLLYLMMKANMAPGVRESEKMSDAELLGQITTLLTAGHETTSTLLTWFVYIITQDANKHVVGKIRAEMDEYFAGRDALDYDALMGMPYLDNCTKEILRLLSPVSNTERYVTHDDVIPLSKPYKTRDGKATFDSINVYKGQMLFIPIQLINRSKAFWGPTADEFDPDRWNNVPKAAKESGFPSHILSFIEGPRGCIGNRFALCEFKALLCALLRTFDMERMQWEIEHKQGVVVRPRVIGQEGYGTQLPVRLTRLQS